MAHLLSEQFVDLLEGVADHTSVPHLSACDDCRKQLDELRGLMTATASVAVPEPSPLFWDHLSARIGEATRMEPQPRPSMFAAWQVRVAAGVAAGALAAVLIVTTSHGPAPSAPPAAQRSEAAAVVNPSDDFSLGLVADFGATLEWEDLREQMALSGRLDADAVELDGAERRELERLLKEELARPAGRSGRS